MRILTCALPYANGNLHLGHLLEYVMADIHARVLRQRGEDVLFVCADDVHGTPVELAARKRGIAPEDLIAEIGERHREDLDAYAISFDEFGTTHSAENKKLSEEFYAAFEDAGLIEWRAIEQFYDEKEKRFLPDRYIKGTCPNCGAHDQNGDSCEVCGTHYEPTELIEPRSVISNTRPILKESRHAFFLLSKLTEQARTFIRSAELQPEMTNYIERWIEQGLADWDVTRDGPYFGFPIPGETNKYFYVWLDAPIGYLSSTAHWAQRHGLENPWNASTITHVIGKDIIYFHFLFWPQMLEAAGYRKPDRIQVHGFLTVEGEKMSKSRGTFVLASELADRYSPDLVRFYLARKIGKGTGDDDFSFDELERRVNGELIGNLLNLSYRTLTLISKRREPLAPSAALYDEESERLIEAVLEHRRAFEAHALAFDLARATSELLVAGDLVNAYIQERAPWKEADNSLTLATAWTATLPILGMLGAVAPGLASRLREEYGIEEDFHVETAREAISATLALERPFHAEPTILVHRIEPKSDPVEELDLRVARIVRARPHPNADKLYLLDLDLGSETRTIVSGLRGFYELEELEGRSIVLVANLKPATIRGETSHGMLLAASVEGPDGTEQRVVLCESVGEPGERIRAGGRSAALEQADIKRVLAAGLCVRSGRVVSGVGTLRSLTGPVSCDIEDGATVR